MMNSLLPLFGPWLNVIVVGLMTQFSFDQQIAMIKKMIEDYRRIERETYAFLFEFSSCTFLGEILSRFLFEYTC